MNAAPISVANHRPDVPKKTATPRNKTSEFRADASRIARMVQGDDTPKTQLVDYNVERYQLARLRLEAAIEKWFA